MNKKTIITLTILACACACACVWFFGGRAVAAEGLYPFEKSATWIQRNINVRLRTLWRRQNLAVENRSLRRENDILRMALSEAGVKPEKVTMPDNEAWICAPILSRNGVTGAKSFLRLGKGSIDGVKLNAAVAVPDGLVGKIEEVSLHTSTVTFITDPSIQVAAEIITGEESAFGKVYGIVSGSGNRALTSESGATILYTVNPLRIKHLERDIVPPARAKIITSGLGGIYPPGLTVGYLINTTHEDETELEREGNVMPAVDFPSLEDVFIRREK